MQNMTYLTIQSWMRTELNLSGNELIIYAIIYGFSQDETSRFSGSRQYLADWCGCTVRSVQNTLNLLLEKGLITKYDCTRQNVKFCEYVANFTTSEKFSPPSEKISPPSEKFSLNNIDNIDNINIISSNTINSITEDNTEFEGHSYSNEELKEEFLGSNKKRAKRHKKSLYDKCLDEIYLYTKNKDLKLQDALIRYLSVRLAIKDKQIYGVNQWIGLLNKLDKTEGKDKVAIVEQSIERGWCSFYPVKENTNNVFSEGDGLSNEPSKDTAEERADKLREQGRRVSF